MSSECTNELVTENTMFKVGSRQRDLWCLAADVHYPTHAPLCESMAGGGKRERE